MSFLSKQCLPRLGAAMLLGLGALASGCGSDGGPGDPGYEPLLDDSLTAVAAAEVYLGALGKIVPNCGGTAPIDCPDSVPGAPITLATKRTRLALSYVAGAAQWNVSADLVLRSPTDIPITIPAAGKCTLHIDTSAGADSVVTVTFPILFVATDSQYGGQRIIFGDGGLTGLTAEDLALLGSISCQTASFGLSLFTDILKGELLGGHAALCGAGGPALFRDCPQMVVEAWTRPRPPAS